MDISFLFITQHTLNCQAICAPRRTPSHVPRAPCARGSSGSRPLALSPTATGRRWASPACAAPCSALCPAMETFTSATSALKTPQCKVRSLNHHFHIRHTKWCCCYGTMQETFVLYLEFSDPAFDLDRHKKPDSIGIVCL